MSDAVPSHPVTLAVDFPDRQLNRATLFFRPIMIVPIAIILALVSGPVRPAPPPWPRSRRRAGSSRCPRC